MACPYGAHPLLQVAEVRAHARGEIGVDDHGGKTFELAEFRQDFVRDGKRKTQALKRCGHPPLVSGVGECKQEANGERIRPGIFHPAQQTANFRVRDRQKDLAVGRYPFLYAEAPGARR